MDSHEAIVRLRAVRNASNFGGRHPSHVLRVREIAEYIGVSRPNLYHKEVEQRYGEKLARFFEDLDAGRIAKVKIDGKYRIERVAKVAPKASTHTTAKTISMKIEWNTGRITGR